MRQEQTSASVVAFGDPLSVYRSFVVFSVRKPTQATATRVATGGYKLGNIVDLLVVRETGSRALASIILSFCKRRIANALPHSTSATR